MDDRFLAAQIADPFGPAPMLIHADWLEERGDAEGAAVLRGLVEGGTPSLHSLALDAELRSAALEPDMFECFLDCPCRSAGEPGTGYGGGDGDGAWHWFGYAAGDGVADGYGCGDRCWFVEWDPDGHGDGCGDDYRPEAEDRP